MYKCASVQDYKCTSVQFSPQKPLYKTKNIILVKVSLTVCPVSLMIYIYNYLSCFDSCTLLLLYIESEILKS